MSRLSRLMSKRVNWRIIILVLLFPLVMLCNVDVFVIPFFKHKGYHGWLLYAIAMPIALAELCYTYYVSGIADQLKKIAFCRKFIIYIIRYFRLSHRLKRFLEAFGYFGIILLGIFAPAGRNGCAIFCRSVHWRTGFILLLFADLIHVALVIDLWKLVWQ